MADLTKAQAARQTAALDKKYRFSHGADTFRGMIAAGKFSRAETATVPKITYSRRKFNRMDYKAQADYERRLAETKTEYRLYYASDSDTFCVVPKLVFDYFNA
jgi:hypothetical protein